MVRELRSHKPGNMAKINKIWQERRGIKEKELENQYKYPPLLESLIYATLFFFFFFLKNNNLFFAYWKKSKEDLHSYKNSVKWK